MITLPTRTACEATLLDGARVWVQTLNDTQRTDVFECSDFTAAERARRYRKAGTSDYETIIEQLEDGGAEMQAGYLADQGYIDGSYDKAANEKYPDAEQPVRINGESDELFDRRVEEYGNKHAEIGQKRQKFIEAAYEGRKKQELATPDTAGRITRCVTAIYKRKRQEAFTFAFICETLARAVRCIDDHGKLYWLTSDGKPDVAKVADLTDAERNHAWNLYINVDKVLPSDIPT